MAAALVTPEAPYAGRGESPPHFLDLLPCGILQCGAKGELLYVSDGFCRMTGFSKDEIDMQFDGCFFNLVLPEDRERVESELRESVLRQSAFSMEYRLRTKSGGTLWVMDRREPTVYENQPAYVCTLMEITAVKQRERDLRQSEERFRFALLKTSCLIFEYDIAARTAAYPSATAERYGLPPQVSNLPDSLISCGVVPPDFADDFREMYRRIEQGEPEAECVIRARQADGEYVWCKITLTAIGGENGGMNRAVGLIEDVTRQREAELACRQEQKYRAAMVGDAVNCMELNLTRDIIEKQEGRTLRAGQDSCSYSQAMENSLQEILPEDRPKYQSCFSRERILAAFSTGTTVLTLEHRREKSGQPEWMRTTLHLLQDGGTGDIRGFIYLKNINNQKLAELTLRNKSRRDPLTGLYHRGETERQIRKLLKEGEPGRQCAFLMIDVDNFKKTNDTYGHMFGDRVLAEMGHNLQRTFRRDDIAGRVGGDEFVVFVRDISAIEIITGKAQAVCDLFRKGFSGENGAPRITCSVGVALSSGEDDTFEKLYQKADTALYEAKRLGRNRFLCYHDGLEVQKTAGFCPDGMES